MKDREAWCAVDYGLQRVRHDLVTEQRSLGKKRQRNKQRENLKNTSVKRVIVENRPK